MAIDYGAVENHLRVGIDVDVEVNTATYQRVKFSFYADGDPDSWDWNDDMSMRITGSAGSSTVNFHKGAQDNQLVATRTVTRDKGSGTSSITVYCTVSGAFNGATPSASRTHTVPAKDVQPPNPPGAGSLDVIDRWETGATLRVGVSTDNNGAAVDDYHIQVASGPSFSGNVVYSDIQEGRTWVVTGLNPGTNYWFHARAHNSAGWGGWSANQVFSTITRPPGVVPNRSMGDIFATIATMLWDAPSDNGGDALIQYELRYRKVGTSTYTIVNTWAEDATFYTATGLEPGTEYEWLVRVRNMAGYGDFQATTFKFNTDDLPPDRPPLPSVSNIGATSGTVNWSVPDARGSTIDGYQVQRATNSSFSGATTATLGVSARSHPWTGLAPATRYYTRVRATSDEGNGLWSQVKSFATTGLSNPYPVVRIWNGSSFVRLDPTSIWDGADFVEVSDIKRWNGSSWVSIAQAPY